MARAVRTASGTPGKPRTTAPAAPERRVGYFRDVVEELAKVIWPTRMELTRMTGIVVATVIIFSAIIGVADYGLSLGFKAFYTSSASKASPTAAPQTTTTTPGATPSSAATATPAIATPKK